MSHVQDVVLNEQDWRIMIAYAVQMYLNGMQGRENAEPEVKARDAEICLDMLFPLLSPVIELAFNGKPLEESTKSIEKAHKNLIKLKSAVNQVVIANESGKDCDLNIFISKEKDTDIPEYAIPYGQYEEVLKDANVDVEARKKEIQPILVPEKKEILI